MRGIWSIGLISALLLAPALLPGWDAASAKSFPQTNSVDYPGAPRRVYDDPPKPPYAMNYTDEAAETLGLKNGRLDAFNFRKPDADPFTPALTGGVDRGGAMIKLIWR